MSSSLYNINYGWAYLYNAGFLFGENFMHLIRIVKFFCVALVILLSLSACVDKKEQLSPLKIVCLGDSITYGHKLADPALQSYPGQLSQQAHGQWKVLNCGVNGATALNKGDIPITGEKTE